MAGEETVGSIVGWLRLDASDFHREITRAIAEIKVLSGMDASVDIKVDSRKIDSAARATKNLTGGITEAAKANRLLEDASSRVAVAQARLNELREGGKTKASSLLSAEAALLRARRAEQDLIFASYEGNVKFSRSNQDVARSALSAARGVDGMSRSFSGLGSPSLIVGGVVAGIALLGPVTAAATAAMVGFAGVAGTAALAYVGFKKEIEEGTALGQAMQAEVSGLGAAFRSLGRTAAGAMSGDVLAGMATLRDYLPTLNDEVGVLAGSLGRAFRVSITGLLSGLSNMMPLLQDGGRYAEALAESFAEFTRSQDFQNFIAYAREKLPEVVAAIASLGSGIKDLTVALAPAGDSLIQIINLTGKFASGTATVIGWLGKLDDVLQLPGLSDEGFGGPLTKGADEAAAATANTTVKMAALAAIQSPLATGLGTTDQSLQRVTEKQRATATSAGDATVAMQLQGNAAGLLKQALDGLNGTNLSAAQAQNAFDSSLANMGTHVDKYGKQITFAGKSINNMSASSVALRGQLNGQVAAAQGSAEAFGQMKGSSEAGRKKLIELKDQIIKNAIAHGVDKDAVQAYVDKLLKIPKKVPPTKLEVEASRARSDIRAFQKAIDSLHGKTVTATVRYAYTGRLPNGGRSTRGGSTFADGGEIRSKVPGYAGGTIIGPGTGRSDSILAGIAGTGELIRVSNGEFISTARSQQRNGPALEAGNRGAKLGVVDGGGSGGMDWASVASLLAAEVSAAVYQGSRRGIAERDVRSRLATVGGFTNEGQS